MKLMTSEKTLIHLSAKYKSNRSPKVSRELGGVEEGLVGIVHVAISDVEKCRSNILGFVFRDRGLGSRNSMENCQAHI